MADPIRLDRDGAVAVLVLDRPAVLNALDETMLAGLEAAVAAVAHDPGVRAVVLRGEGPAFMAGGDVKMFSALVDRPGEERRRRFAAFITRVHAVLLALVAMPKPVLGAAHGVAAGFGVSLVAATDIAVAGRSARFDLAYARIGTSPDGGSTWFLPRLIGLRQAMAMALLTEAVDAEAALALGLVTRVVPDQEVTAATMAMAHRLAAGPAGVLARTKALLRRSLDVPLESQLEAERQSFAACAAEDDFVEGVRAFVAKRPPRFAGGGDGAG